MGREREKTTVIAKEKHQKNFGNVPYVGRSRKNIQMD